MSRLHTTEIQCLTNNECQNYLAFLVNITCHLNNGNLKLIEKQQTVHEFVQQCCFFQSKARKFAYQADNIHSFIHSGHFYSAPSSPLLLRGAPDTAQILYQSFMPKRTDSKRTCPRSLR